MSNPAIFNLIKGLKTGSLFDSKWKKLEDIDYLELAKTEAVYEYLYWEELE
jgi:hypothetical protein